MLSGCHDGLIAHVSGDEHLRDAFGLGEQRHVRQVVFALLVVVLELAVVVPIKMPDITIINPGY